VAQEGVKPGQCLVIAVAADVAGHGESEGGFDVKGMAFYDEALIHALQYPGGDGAGVGFVHSEQKHGEFVPAEADNGILRPNAGGMPGRKFCQDGIAGAVTVGVVYAFEVI
jgi:hypothetical protein